MAQRLSDLLRALGIPFEESPSRRWVKILSQPSVTYVVQGCWDHSYLTWCDRWDERAIERYATAEEAISAGLRRASRPFNTSGEPAVDRASPTGRA